MDTDTTVTLTHPHDAAMPHVTVATSNDYLTERQARTLADRWARGRGLTLGKRERAEDRALSSIEYRYPVIGV